VLGFEAENKNFPKNNFPMIYLRSSDGVYTFEDQNRVYVPARTLSMKTDEADLKVV
jgi:hypothetical protein